MAEHGINLRNINFSYEGDKTIFDDFTIRLPASKVSVILGPSGCGKTTLLNLISGLLKPQDGVINCSNDAISLLFQEPRLLPWRTIRRNLEIVLAGKLGKSGSRTKAEHYLKLVGLGDYVDYYPDALSGGMRQRAAIARAFAYPADTILMDEPFQALDLGLKINLTRLFSDLWIDDRRTAVFVTHDINEAILLGDDIFVLSASRPVEIVEHLVNTEPHAERSLESAASIEIEKKLFRLLT